MKNILKNTAAIVLSVLIGAAASAAEEPEVGKRWALLIGVNDYVSLRPLYHCVDDMQALRDQLVACGFPEDQVYLLRDKADDAARLPSKRNIELRLKLLLSLVKKNDLVFIAFSGHGMQLGAKSYWCPTEAHVDDPVQTLVALDDVYSQLEQCPAALRLIVVDACRNDPSRDKSGEHVRLDAKMLENPPEGILVFNSCGPNEKSKEDERLRHGVFTHFVLEALQGKADTDGDGVVSLGELWEHAGEKTQKHVGDVFNDFQQPRLRGELTATVLKFPITPKLVLPERFLEVALQLERKDTSQVHDREYVEIRSALLRKVARVSAKCSHYDVAMSFINEIEKADNAKWYDAKLFALLDAAAAAESNGHSTRAASMYADARTLARSTDDSYIKELSLLRIAAAQVEAKNIAEAKINLSEASKLGSRELERSLVWLYAKTGDFEAFWNAYSTLEEAERKHTLGAAAANGQVDRAIQEALRLKARADQAEALVAIGSALADLENTAGAENAFKEALSIISSFIDAPDLKCRLLVAYGNAWKNNNTTQLHDEITHSLHLFDSARDGARIVSLVSLGQLQKKCGDQVGLAETNNDIRRIWDASSKEELDFELNFFELSDFPEKLAEVGAHEVVTDFARVRIGNWDARNKMLVSAAALYKWGNKMEAEELFMEAAEMFDQYHPEVQVREAALSHLLATQIASGDFADAEETIAIIAAKDKARAYYYMASAYARVGNLSKAEASLLHAYSLDGKDDQSQTTSPEERTAISFLVERGRLSSVREKIDDRQEPLAHLAVAYGLVLSEARSRGISPDNW